MAVKIGHATATEYRTAKGGKSGDQTGTEVYSRNWYSKPWHTVFRPKSATVAEKIAKAMEQACANNNIGYDQGQRTTLYTLAKEANWDISKIKTKCETDCSALVAVCCNAAGVKVSKDMWTGNQKSVLNATGKFTAYTASKYVSGCDYLKRGDILLGNGHTAIVLSNGLRAGTTTTTTTKPVTTTTKKPTTTIATGSFLPSRGYFKRGDVSPKIGKIASFMRATFPAYTDKKALGNTFGAYLEASIKEFQRRSKLEPDGCIGKLTLAALKKNGFKE